MKRHTNHLLLLLAVPFILGSCKPQSQTQEYTESILTYPFSDTSPLPIIYKRNDIYPYSRIDGFSHEGRSQEWKVVKLENDYVEVYILPELGGKVWGAIDKTTGKEFIYKNDVVKFRDVAMRGPWTSGGIEWNTGVIGHHPGGAAPVNYRSFTDDEGTAHCVVGGIDLTSHLEWRVDIALPVNTSYFESRTFWYNTTPYYQAYYHWNNAAVKSADDLQYLFPGNFWLGHNGQPNPWPVDEHGTDISWYKNNALGGSSSYHIYGSIDNYFVSFYHDENFGSGHWSSSYGALGKKIFMWSQARNGAIWENLLTDTHGQYVEVQAGRMLNQNSFSSAHTPFKQPDFIPYNADLWVERWFPVRETGGVTRVAESGAIHLNYSDEGLQLLFSPMREINEPMVMLVNGNEVLNDPTLLKPSEVFDRTFQGISEADTLEVLLGTEQLYSSKVNYILERPYKSPKDALDDPYILARELENRRSYGKALDTYLGLLEKEPMNLAATERVAELYFRRGEYELANQYAKRVLEIDAYLPGANFIYANLQKLQGDFTNARDGFRWSMRSLEYRSATLQLLSEINLMEGNMERAYEQASKSLSYNQLNLNSYKIQAIAQRKMNHPGEVKDILAGMVEIDPLSHFALFEEHLLQPTPSSLEAFNHSFKSEMISEEYLELGLFYVGLGLNAEAVKVLEQAPGAPVVDFWLAWLNRSDQEVSQGYLEKAVNANPEFIFPFRSATLPILEWAGEQNPSWITDYYSSLILWSKGRDDEALNLLTKWGDDPEFAPFYHTRAYLQGINTDVALKDMQRALVVDPDQWRITRELVDIYIRRGDNASALAVAESGYNRFQGNYIIGLKYSKCLMLTQHYQKSLDVLSEINVLPFEGENTGQSLFVYNNLMLALEGYKSGEYGSALDFINQSETYPENLGSGAPSFPDYRNQDLLRIKIYDRTGEHEKSGASQDRIEEYTKKFGKQRRGSIFEQQFTESLEQPF